VSQAVLLECDLRDPVGRPKIAGLNPVLGEIRQGSVQQGNACALRERGKMQ
jgi:hypothetical protein